MILAVDYMISTEVIFGHSENSTLQNPTLRSSSNGGSACRVHDIFAPINKIAAKVPPFEVGVVCFLECGSQSSIGGICAWAAVVGGQRAYRQQAGKRRSGYDRPLEVGFGFSSGVGTLILRSYSYIVSVLSNNSCL